MTFSCSICFENLEIPPEGEVQCSQRVKISSARCGHFFHDYCIRAWLTQLKGMGRIKHCPCCRTNIGRLKTLYPTFLNDRAENENDNEHQHKRNDQHQQHEGVNVSANVNILPISPSPLNNYNLPVQSSSRWNLIYFEKLDKNHFRVPHLFVVLILFFAVSFGVMFV